MDSHGTIVELSSDWHQTHIELSSYSHCLRVGLTLSRRESEAIFSDAESGSRPWSRRMISIAGHRAQDLDLRPWGAGSDLRRPRGAGSGTASLSVLVWEILRPVARGGRSRRRRRKCWLGQDQHLKSQSLRPHDASPRHARTHDTTTTTKRSRFPSLDPLSVNSDLLFQPQI